jgi:hypothetical protein
LLNCTNEPAQFNKESLWDIFFGASLLQLSLNMGFKQQPAFGTLQIFNLTVRRARGFRCKRTLRLLLGSYLPA